MLIAVLGDLHWGCRQDNKSILEYQIKFFEEVFWPYCKKHGIRNIIQTGDFFDNRNSVKTNTLNLVKRHFLDALERESITMTTIVGNHDMAFKNSLSINSLGEHLDGYNECITVINKPKKIRYGDTEIGFQPWICEENLKASMKFLKTAELDILVGHYEISGFAMQMGIESNHGLNADLFHRIPMVVSGHYHDRSTKGNINYVGTPYDLTWGESTVTKGFHVIDTDTKQMEFIENKEMLHNKVTYNPGKKIDLSYKSLKGKFIKLIVDECLDREHLSGIIDKIEHNNPAELKVFDSTMILGTEDEDVDIENVKHMDTLDFMKKYTENVCDDNQKDDIIKMLSSLYTEALEIT